MDRHGQLRVIEDQAVFSEKRPSSKGREKKTWGVRGTLNGIRRRNIGALVWNRRVKATMVAPLWAYGGRAKKGNRVRT